MKILKSSQCKYLESKKKLNRNIFVALLVVGITAGIILGVVEPDLLVLWPLLALCVAASLWFLRQYLLWRAGIEGEQKVVVTLISLDDSYFLVNDIKLPSSQGNIDHILLSPKGLFVIETKNYSGSYGCYKDEWYRGSAIGGKPIGSVTKQAKGNAISLRNFVRETTKVNVYVNALCVFTNPSVELILHQPTMPILQLAELTTFLDQFKPSISLTEQELQVIAQSLLHIPSEKYM